MANKIIPKRSSVSGKVPVTSDLDVGEIAVNLTDRKIYTKDAGGTVVQLGGGAGSGDVIGLNSSTDNAIARFDGATGKIIQNSGATIDDSGNLSSPAQYATGTGANKMPAGTTAQRPASPQVGMIRFNSERNVFEGYDNSGWVAVNAPALNVEYLVVAGGGGGGGYGGGGGGGAITSAVTLTKGISYSVAIGGGGAGGPGTGGLNGGNSTFAGAVAIGGGGGGGDTTPAGKSGGSGGGGNRSSGAGGAGTTNQGWNGGAGGSSNGNGGGGGGWGAAGGNSSGFNSGAGGSGATSAISGSSVFYAGGGGAGANTVVGPNVAGAGGNGGGGNGGTMNDGTEISAPVAGTGNRGGGGGGRGYGSNGPSGANGGSGVVILKYPDAYTLTIGPGLTASTVQSSGFKITTFTAGADNISWSA